MIEPLEVSIRTVGRSCKRERNVIGVILPTPVALRLGTAEPIFVSLGDVKVDWTASRSEGLKMLMEAMR